jgi:histidinol-phosphate/aromatic aminotransferase/cobyric acid decarboxylase-like protein/SAM-dependent methyltransferase
VLDLGCGTGRHAIALAERGFLVTGADVGTWALKAADARAAAVGVRVEWLCLDLLRDIPWPVGLSGSSGSQGPAGEFDAIVCVQSFGWGSDAQQLRLLREARRVLVPGGILVLDHSNVLAIAGHFVPEATFETEGLRADFHRGYRVPSGRSAGEIEISRGDAEPVVIHDDVRLYQPAEVQELLTRAGFDVERVDADFTIGRPPALMSRYVQFIARTPESRTTAIATWDRQPDERPTAVDLRWSPDEIEFVRSAVDRAFQGAAAAATRAYADEARAYHVTDPYAAGQVAPVLSEHFGTDLSPDMVTAGTGATGLLHACAGLAVPGPVLHLDGGHPDLPLCAARLGAETFVTRIDRIADLIADLDRHNPSLLVLDRPTITGDLYARALLDEIAEAAHDRGTIVVLDEAYAVYAGPGESCVPAVADHDNLIVVRSMSKGYCCGGLRVGFALASPELTRRLREFTPPLGANSFGLAVALGLLNQGDVFAGLRARIAEVKPEVSATLRRAGLEVTEGAPCLPWLSARGGDDARTVIEKHDVRVKEIGDRIDGRLFKIAVPLSDARLAAFRAAFAHGG